MSDEVLRAQEALGGDLVICECERHPLVISLYGRSVVTEEGSGAGSSAREASIASTAAIASAFDERFALKDDSGNGLANVHHTIRLPSRELRHGTTDAEGRTARYRTNGARDIAVRLVHKQEA
jgi:hypothetical protein